MCWGKILAKKTERNVLSAKLSLLQWLEKAVDLGFALLVFL